MTEQELIAIVKHNERTLKEHNAIGKAILRAFKECETIGE